ncbi:ATP-binding protein [Streptomyces fumanus]|uniref:ATP-binding protein n=1 Tax=Streptomyces fumanus TaxID=67302 RepID=UPI0033E3C02D
MSSLHLPALLAHDWSVGYPMTARSVGLARRQVRRRLTMWAWAGDAEDAVLVTSELVGNAVRYGRVPGHELWLRLRELEDRVLVVDVSDPVRVLPEVRDDPEGESGRGLLVVTGLATKVEWFLREGVGKTVRAWLAP